MNQTIVQKILSRASGRDDVTPGEVIWADPDLVVSPEVSFPAFIKGLREVGVTELGRPDRVVVVTDHEYPAQSVKGAERNKKVRELCQELGVAQHFEGEGIAHPLVVERGLVAPGMLVANSDTHAPALGGVGALAIPFGFELSMVLGLGRIWLRVPESLRVELKGALPPGVTARDVVLQVMRTIGSERSDYRAIEYVGSTLSELSIEERMTICNLSVDMGAKSAVMPTDQRTLDFLEERGVVRPQPMAADDGADYAATFSLDCSGLEPLVCVPPNPENVQPISSLSDVGIDHAFIGSCASGTLAELRAVADLLRGRRVHERVQLLISPSTKRAYQAAMEEGLLATFLEAGATVIPPTCGPCFGGLAQLGPGETRISTSTRNDPGRMGSKDASIYLASAITVASSALVGHISAPGAATQTAQEKAP